jgi:hypothetical protein
MNAKMLGKSSSMMVLAARQLLGNVLIWTDHAISGVQIGDDSFRIGMSGQSLSARTPADGEIGQRQNQKDRRRQLSW